MKCFTNEWYRNGRVFTDEIMSTAKRFVALKQENYRYYPQWYKDRDSGGFLFEEAVITDFVQKDGDVQILMRGVDILNPKNQYCLRLKSAEILEAPGEIKGRCIVAEELYCNREYSELHLLLPDNTTSYARNLTIRFRSSELKRVK